MLKKGILYISRLCEDNEGNQADLLPLKRR